MTRFDKVIARLDQKASTMVKFHFIMVLVWILLCFPTFVWLMDSVPWIVFMSIYAVVTAHFSSLQAALADMHTNE